MISIRRWYIYLVSAITAQGVAWALIALLRKLFLGETADRELIALQLAIIIVALPLFLVHWLWGQRLAGQEAEERASFPRRFYLYGMLAAFLVPIIYNANGGLRALLNMILGVRPTLDFSFSNNLTNGEMLISTLTAVIILAALWSYHWLVKRRDDRLLPESDESAVLRQLYGYSFSLIGLVMAAVGAGRLLERLIAPLLSSRLVDPIRPVLATEVTRLALGLVVWLVFWRLAQQAFAGPDERERESVVRKAYLYLVVFVGALAVISTATILLADILARLLDVSTGGGLSTAIAVIIISGSVWAYHAFIIRQDADVAAEVGRQALVRRIYTYLMAGLGLGAFLIGLAGTLTVLFLEMDVRGLRSEFWDELPTFLAMLIIGLVVWRWHWRQANREVAQPPPAALDERRSFVRRLYLYFYIFVATLTLLGSVIYIVSQLLMVLLGARETAGLFLDISQAFSYTLISVAIWLYHGRIIRQDGQVVHAAELAQLKQLHVAVIDAGDGLIGRTLADRLHEKAPGAIVHPIGLTETAVAALQTDAGGKTPLELLAEAEVIVGPWSMAVPAGHGGVISPDIAAAVTASPAQKILIPEPESGYAWAGVDNWKIENIAKEVAADVRALTLGEKLAAQRGLAPWVVVLLVLVSLCVLTSMVPAVLQLLIEGFM